MLDRDAISNVILNYSMKRIEYPDIEDMRITNAKRINFTVSDSKFNVLDKLDDTGFNVWRKNYMKLYNQYKAIDDNVTKYIIISDLNDNILYCNRINAD